MSLNELSTSSEPQFESKCHPYYNNYMNKERNITPLQELEKLTDEELIERASQNWKNWLKSTVELESLYR